MGRKSTIAAWTEYLAVRAGLLLIDRLEPPRALWLADRLGDLAFRLDRRHRERALEQVRRTFGDDVGRDEVVRIARGAFRSLFRVAVETHLMPRLVAERGLEGVIDVRGAEHVADALSDGRGAVVWSAHLGNWEVIAAAGRPLGMRLRVVGRPLDNPLLDDLLRRRRSDWALEVIPKQGGAARIARALREGACVAMLLDQHAGRHGLVVDFMGRPASTFRTPAELAVRLGVPLIGGYGLRLDDTPRFRLEFEPPLRAREVARADRAAREREVVRLTRRMNDSIERRVRAHPEQWNWLHRRWREGLGAPATVAEAAR